LSQRNGYTRECIVFDLLSIPLYHGWLIDPVTENEEVAVIGANSYNQLPEFIIKILLSEQFLV